MVNKPDFYQKPWNPNEKLSRQDSEISILRRDVKELLTNMASLREEKDARIHHLESALKRAETALMKTAKQSYRTSREYDLTVYARQYFEVVAELKERRYARR
jgi:ElaB/YqjD/DUF883 family membrane-anchored ribosome-binding protein